MKLQHWASPESLKSESDSHRGLNRGRKRTCDDAAAFKNGFQNAVFAKLIRLEAYDHEAVLRKKLARWRIHAIPDGSLARRGSRILQRAFERAPVRVANVLFRTWLNGWCTARRFQVAHSACLFHCRVDAVEMV